MRSGFACPIITAARDDIVPSASSGAKCTPPRAPMSASSEYSAKQPFDAPGSRPLIFTVLRAEIYEVSVNAAAFQRTELPRQRLRLLARAPRKDISGRSPDMP